MVNSCEAALICWSSLSGSPSWIQDWSSRHQLLGQSPKLQKTFWVIDEMLLVYVVHDFRTELSWWTKTVHHLKLQNTLKGFQHHNLWVLSCHAIHCQANQTLNTRSRKQLFGPEGRIKKTKCWCGTHVIWFPSFTKPSPMRSNFRFPRNLSCKSNLK